MSRCDARKLQAAAHPSEVATCSGTPNSRIVTCPEVLERTLRASRSAKGVPRMSTRGPRKEYWQFLLRRLGDLGKRHFNSLMTQELHTRVPMFSATPVPPEQRLFPNGERVQEHTHAGSGFAVAFPFHWHCSRSGQGRQLWMLAASTTRKLPSARSSSFLDEQMVASRIPQRPIRLERKISSGETTGFARR